MRWGKEGEVRNTFLRLVWIKYESTIRGLHICHKDFRQLNSGFCNWICSRLNVFHLHRSWRVVVAHGCTSSRIKTTFYTHTLTYILCAQKRNRILYIYNNSISAPLLVCARVPFIGLGITWCGREREPGRKGKDRVDVTAFVPSPPDDGVRNSIHIYGCTRAYECNKLNAINAVVKRVYYIGAYIWSPRLYDCFNHV